MTVQDNPFTEDPIFIAMEDHGFMLPVSFKGTILVVNKKNPMDKELHTRPHITSFSAHEWDSQNVLFPKSSRTVEG